MLSESQDPLPITETGYKSYFLPREVVEEYGGPVTFTLAWLEHEAKTPEWHKYAEERKQLSLF